MLHTIRGSDLGPQLHANTIEPRPTLLGVGNRPGHLGPLMKPHRGIWTSTLNTRGSSAFLDWSSDQLPHTWHAHNHTWFLLEPHDDSRLLVIDSTNDLRSAFDRYGIPDERALDFDRILHDGYDGLHVTHRGVKARLSRSGQPVASLDAWDAESTVWLRWSFVRWSVWYDRPPIPQERERWHDYQTYGSDIRHWWSSFDHSDMEDAA